MLVGLPPCWTWTDQNIGFQWRPVPNEATFPLAGHSVLHPLSVFHKAVTGFFPLAGEVLAHLSASVCSSYFPTTQIAYL